MSSMYLPAAVVEKGVLRSPPTPPKAETLSPLAVGEPSAEETEKSWMQARCRQQRFSPAHLSHLHPQVQDVVRLPGRDRRGENPPQAARDVGLWGVSGLEEPMEQSKAGTGDYSIQRGQTEWERGQGPQPLFHELLRQLERAC